MNWMFWGWMLGAAVNLASVSLNTFHAAYYRDPISAGIAVVSAGVYVFCGVMAGKAYDAA